nr:hypothetical protein [Pedobacter sp. ASV19]
MEVEVNQERIKLINIINHYFTSPTSTDAGNLFYTTMDLYRKIQSIYPSENYCPADVTEVLIYLKIETINGAGDKIFWYLQER